MAHRDERLRALLSCGSSDSVAPADGSPAHWDPIDPAHGNASLVLLSKDNAKHAAEIAAVEQGWTNSAETDKIVSIHRVQNLHLHQQYEARKAELQKAGQLAQSDVRVYHGTRRNVPSLIHSGTTGFDPACGSGGSVRRDPSGGTQQGAREGDLEFAPGCFIADSTCVCVSVCVLKGGCGSLLTPASSAPAIFIRSVLALHGARGRSLHNE